MNSNERRDFLQTLMTTALLTGVASEMAHAQQPGNVGIGANVGQSSLKQALPAPFTGMDASFTLLTLQPGAAAPRAHSHPGFVLGYVIEGEYLFAINGETPRVVRAGEVFYEPPGATHTTHANATSNQPVKLLAIVIGPLSETSPTR